jgi:large subunit ribosomal protein L4
MKAAALRGALSDRARHGRIHVVTSLVSGTVPSTKDVVALLAGLTDRKNMLIVLDRSDIVSMKSVRNLDNVHVLAADQLNTYDVLCADDVVFTQAGFDAFVAGPVGNVTSMDVLEVEDSAAATETTETAETETEAVETDGDTGFGPDSSAALEDGSAPAGFDVKGNTDSMKYHVPGSRWYDATAPEVWFRSADAAQAAGFAPAGGESAQQISEEEK